MAKKSVSQPRLAKIMECLEKCIYHGSGGLPRVALFGVGADMNHLELQKRCLTVDIIYSKLDSMDDKEFLSELENSTSGSIFAIHKFTSTDKESVNKGKGVKVMFLTPCAARKALELNKSEFNGTILNVAPSHVRVDHKVFPFLAVKAIVYWPQDWTFWLTRVGILAQHQITGTANCCAILQLPMHIILISAYALFLLSSYNFKVMSRALVPSNMEIRS